MLSSFHFSPCYFHFSGFLFKIFRCVRGIRLLLPPLPVARCLGTFHFICERQIVRVDCRKWMSSMWHVGKILKYVGYKRQSRILGTGSNICGYMPMTCAYLVRIFAACFRANIAFENGLISLPFEAQINDMKWTRWNQWRNICKCVSRVYDLRGSLHRSLVKFRAMLPYAWTQSDFINCST